MSLIDVTSMKDVPFAFAERTMTSVDKKQARKLLRKVYDHITDFSSGGSRPNSVSFITKNRRNCRIILYDVERLLASKDVFVVVFYANVRDGLSDEARADFFETDWKIAMSLVGTENILCYASQELANRNWFNIVLFTEAVGKQDVLQSDTHKYAAYTLAPQRFTWIRLHNALLPEGLMAYNDVVFTRTKYYDFDNHWFAGRQYAARSNLAQSVTIEAKKG